MFTTTFIDLQSEILGRRFLIITVLRYEVCHVVSLFNCVCAILQVQLSLMRIFCAIFFRFFGIILFKLLLFGDIVGQYPQTPSTQLLNLIAPHTPEIYLKLSKLCECVDSTHKILEQTDFNILLWTLQQLKNNKRRQLRDNGDSPK